MEQKPTNLYRVRGKTWNSPAYVAADTQQQAVEKIATAYETEDPYKLTIEYVDEVYT